MEKWLEKLTVVGKEDEPGREINAEVSACRC